MTPDTPAIEAGHAAAAVPAGLLPAIEVPRTVGHTTAAVPPAETSPRMATPAAQVQPALWVMARAGGTQQVTISLHPAELGRVEVRLDRDAAGTTQVALLVERPETLHALVRDQAQLGQALDRAGVPAEARSVVIQVAPAPQSEGLSLGEGGGSSGGGAGRGSGDGRRPDSAPSGSRDFGLLADATAEQPGARWVRAGIDITA